MWRARFLGHAEVRLDTLPVLTAAIALYESAGFRRIAAYNDTRFAGTLHVARALPGSSNEKAPEFPPGPVASCLASD